jgi:hypothetical protein
VTINNNAGLIQLSNWNENNLNPLSSNHQRASLVPAAAVIPALIAYIKVVAVKKLVVGTEKKIVWSTFTGFVLYDLFFPTGYSTLFFIEWSSIARYHFIIYCLYS